MDIGTAKPSRADREAVPYHLVDLVDPGEEFSVRQFQEAARQVMTQIGRRRHRALLVGGTGLYLRAVVDDLELPGRWPEIAAALEAEADRPGDWNCSTPGWPISIPWRRRASSRAIAGA
jgi:tRNA dimethylallyltransferase